MTPSQPSPTNLSDELREKVRGILNDLYVKAVTAGVYQYELAESDNFDERIDAITAAYAEALLECVPEKVADNIGSSSSEHEHGFRRGFNAALDTLLENLKEHGLIK